LFAKNSEIPLVRQKDGVKIANLKKQQFSDANAEKPLLVP